MPLVSGSFTHHWHRNPLQCNHYNGTTLSCGEFLTHWHLLSQEGMVSGRATQAFPIFPIFSAIQRKKTIKDCSIKLHSNFQVGFKAGWGCVSEMDISCCSPEQHCQKIPILSRSVTVQKWRACCQNSSSQRMRVFNTSTWYTQNQLPSPFLPFLISQSVPNPWKVRHLQNIQACVTKQAPTTSLCNKPTACNKPI